MGKLLGNKIFVIGGSLVVLLALGVVLGLTIVRVQQPKPTVTQPKAADSCQPAPECCNRIAGGAGFDACTWEGGRGWCRLEQCAGSDGVDSNCAHENGDPKAPRKGPANCNCGLFVLNYCNQQPKPEEKSNPCWTNQPIPKNFNASTLSWEWDTTWSNEIKSANAYVWTSSARSGDAYATATINSSTGFKSVKTTDFSPALQPNTTYYLKVNPNSYYYPDQAYWCMDKATAGWSFTTGSFGGATNMTASCPDPGSQATLSWTPPSWANRALLSVTDKTTGASAFSENNVTYTQKTITTMPGHSYTWLVGEQGGPGQYVSVDGPPFTCAGGATCSAGQTQCGTSCVDLQTNSANCGGCGLACKTSESCVKGVCTTSACTKDSDCPSGQVCVNGTCTSNEVNACWGNGGANGKCYDCNGDGEVNILDFSCFRSKYQQNV